MTTKNKAVVGTAPGCKPGVDAVISVRNLRKWYNVGSNLFGIGKKIFLKAVDDVSFDIERKKTFGLVGESGCGKTTTLKVLLGLEEPTEGKMIYKGKDIAILRTMGATRSTIMRVFLIAGASIGVVGTLSGLMLGLTFALNIESVRQWIQGLTKSELFAPEIYFLSQPIAWNSLFFLKQ